MCSPPHRAHAKGLRISAQRCGTCFLDVWGPARSHCSIRVSFPENSNFYYQMVLGSSL